jgi:hypothetical protein
MGIIWELDFYSRPLVDDNNKKLWEVLICESPLDVTSQEDSLFRYSRFCANTEVNSVWLRQTLEEAIAQAGKTPDKIRFFRRQMKNMITKGCEDAGISAYPSRRTIALNRWLQERMETVYPTYPNYKPGTNPSVNLGESIPQPLPDALIGQQWAFVTLNVDAFQDMPDWQIDFGESFPLEGMGVQPDTPIPGLLIFSPRALPLAAWMSGLELAFVHFKETEPAQLLLETGADNSWSLVDLTTPQMKEEATRFEQAKQNANQLHFLAVQSSPDAEAFTGFWLLQELHLA